MMPQASTLQEVAHRAGVGDVPVRSCQTHTVVVLRRLVLSTGVVVLVVVGHHRAHLRRRGC